MKSNETVLNAKNQFQTIGKILAVICGVHPLQVIRETFAPNLKDQKNGFTGDIDFDGRALHQPISPDQSLLKTGMTSGSHSNISSVHQFYLLLGRKLR